MSKNTKKNNLKWIWRAVFWTTGAYLIILGGIFLFFSYKYARNNKAHDELLLKLRNVEELAYIRNTKDNYGGETPAGAIYMYYEFLESEQYPLASTIFTQETRAEHLSKLKDISEPTMRQFVEVLKVAEREVMGVFPENKSFELKSPIRMEFRKVPGYTGKDVWQIESIDYQLL